jgi:hypothetical protein
MTTIGDSYQHTKAVAEQTSPTLTPTRLHCHTEENKQLQYEIQPNQHATLLLLIEAVSPHVKDEAISGQKSTQTTKQLFPPCTPIPPTAQPLSVFDAYASSHASPHSGHTPLSKP